MKNRIDPALPLIDFKTIKENVDRKIRRRRTQSSPSEAGVIMEEDPGIDEKRIARSHRDGKKSSRYKRKNFDDSERGSLRDVYKHGERKSELKERNKAYLDSNGDKQLNEGRTLTENTTTDEERLENEEQEERRVEKNISQYNSLKKAVSNWMHLRPTKRDSSQFLKNFEALNLKLLFEEGILKRKGTAISEITGILDEDIDGYADERKQSIDEAKQRKLAKSKELIHYFVTLAKDKDEEKAVDLDYIERLIIDGADINKGDRYGQTALHEVARTWHPDVAQFFIENGAEVDKVDEYGRSPLHVASAVDYSEMVEFLLSKGADIHLKTLGENQTPIHYAAKNDACGSLATLLQYGASVADKDFKGRTPLQLGAELDRSEACKVLLNEGAPAGVWDDSGMSCMSLMILKMPPVALEALDQFHIKDRANRKQYFYLNYLEPPFSDMSTGAKSSLKVAVEEHQFSIIMHPVMQRLIEAKWNWFGKIGACVHFAINLFFCITWTVLLCTLPDNVNKLHSSLPQDSYHIVLEVLVVLILFYWIVAEFREYRNSIRERDDFIRWREKELERDIKFCHPRWPEEKAYIEREIAELADLKPSYLVDWWNYFDWLTYAFIISTIVCHIIAVARRSSKALDAEKAVGSAMLILQWTRLMKFVRAFKALGPFVVILRHVISDTARFAFLFFIFYIPYAAALWVLFGKKSVSGYSNFEELAYNLLQITVVGDFGFSDLAGTDGRMARLLCGTYIVVSGIVCLNLFIALLSDTFQRVYDNVQANAQMLRASRVLNFEDNFSRKRRERYLRRIHRRCSPEISYYDDDMTDASDQELKRMTHQIKNEVDSMKEFLHGKFGPPDEEKAESRPDNHRHDKNDEELKSLKREIDLLKSNQEHSMKIINMQLMSINSMLADVVSKKKKKRSSGRGLGESQGMTSSETATAATNVVRVAPISFDNGSSQA